MGICPRPHVNAQGQLIPKAKIRGEKRVIQAIVEQTEQHAEGGLAYSGKCYISHSAYKSAAQQVAELVTEKFPALAAPVEIYDIGTTIGSHTGPGTVALFFWGDERID